MQLDDLAAVGQADSVAFVSFLVVQPAEKIENVLVVFSGNTDAIVTNREPPATVRKELVEDFEPELLLIGVVKRVHVA